MLWLGVRYRALLRRSELAMNARAVNLTILLLLVELGIGLGSFLIGDPDTSGYSGLTAPVGSP